MSTSAPVTIRVTELPDGICLARIGLDRPAAANALSTVVVEQLHDALGAAEDAGAAVIVVEAAGRAFCGGLDLSGLEDETDASLLLRLCRIQLLLERVRASPALTVALVEGAAVGAGADLVLATDVRLALPTASLRFPGPGFGAVLGSGRLAAESSPAFAHEAALTGRRIEADEAQQVGLWRVHATRGDLDGALERLARSAGRLPAQTPGRLRAALSPAYDADPLGHLVRSLVSEPGLADRIRAHRDRALPSPTTDAPRPEGIR